jgi:hypothetical protein
MKEDPTVETLFLRLKNFQKMDEAQNKENSSIIPLPKALREE